MLRVVERTPGLHLPPCLGVSSAPAKPDVSVVIATRDRPDELRRCLAAIVNSTVRASYQVVVVDDGSQPALTRSDIAVDGDLEVTLLRREGVGPAQARNAGIDGARGSAVLFTDDDTIPRLGWLDAAWDFLSTHPRHVGVTGPTTSPPYDRLYFHSVSATVPGHFLTCNIAYRREALLEIRGFAEIFPYAHAEDLDLGVRITKLGEVGYSEGMSVVHPPRPATLVAQMRRGRDMASDAMLFARHPDVYPTARYMTGTGYALALNAKRWLHSAARDMYGVGANPWRALRFLALASGYTAQGCTTLLGRALK